MRSGTSARLSGGGSTVISLKETRPRWRSSLSRRCCASPRNILAHPEEEKYRRFKINNDHIKSKIVEPKGSMELVMDLGFHIKAENFESYVLFTGKRYHELRVGSSIMEEILEREIKKQEEEETRRQREKVELEAYKQKLHDQFLDDRQSVSARLQRERHLPPEKGIPARKGGPKKANIATIHG
ncbi:hypothetical protein OH76DRAFT_1397015 [Lentinus brumalis]|uniref:PUB domain-containing protein n=1 Tax=Lentinus brumalis TaxID=2498619 RepID=A0A371DSV6_9APHY|nr:hypothetical protein OH76DRAFT_1397015 [Polyporus brumalis]